MNEPLSLKDLTKKLAGLLALSLANRPSDLVRLFLEGRRYTPDGVHISPVGLPKQSNPQQTSGRLPVFIPMFQEDQLLCPVACLQVYEKRTAQFRKPGTGMQLFLSILALHNPVSSSTIARWIKLTLQASGVDVSTFSAHSTRGAATTAAALAGISMQEIMNQAGWARESTFC